MSKPQLLKVLDLRWEDVPQEACRLAKEAAGPYQVMQDIMPSLPDIGAKVWYNPDNETVFIRHRVHAETEKQASWYIALRQVPGVDSIETHFFKEPPNNEPYILVKQALGNADLFHPLVSAAQYTPNALNSVWGGPNPLAATIGGGLLGAGLGYAGGWLAEKVLPEDKFEPGVLRRNTALLGGLAGAAPGMWHGLDQQFRGPNPGWGAWVRHFPWVKESRFTEITEGLKRELPAEALELNDLWIKAADEAGGELIGRIPVDQFGRTIWNDLSSQGGFTSAPIAAATTGLIQAASLSQGGANYVTPVDIARIGLGMGSGYMSGLFVGKALGALAGLRPEAQKSLQDAGVWAGILSNIVPMAFGG